MALRSERRFTALDNAVSGMMTSFSYTKLDGTTKSYMVLVIDPQLRTDDGKEYLHGLLIDQLSDPELLQLAVTLGQTISIDPDDRRAPVTNLQTDEAYARYLQSYKGRDLYRKFIRSNIKGFQQILLGGIDD